MTSSVYPGVKADLQLINGCTEKRGASASIVLRAFPCRGHPRRMSASISSYQKIGITDDYLCICTLSKAYEFGLN